MNRKIIRASTGGSNVTTVMYYPDIAKESEVEYVKIRLGDDAVIIDEGKYQEINQANFEARFGIS